MWPFLTIKIAVYALRHGETASRDPFLGKSCYDLEWDETGVVNRLRADWQLEIYILLSS